ncbi:hypothetical protein ACJMK2_020933, partial [Sinanodonta woodiana]
TITGSYIRGRTSVTAQELTPTRQPSDYPPLSQHRSRHLHDSLQILQLCQSTGANTYTTALRFPTSVTAEEQTPTRQPSDSPPLSEHRS